MSCLGKGLKEKLANVPVGKDLFDGLTEKDRKQNEMMVNIALTIKKERNSRGLTISLKNDFHILPESEELSFLADAEYDQISIEENETGGFIGSIDLTVTATA